MWSEHGAICEVRKFFTDGASERVVIEVAREAGNWKLVSGVPGF